MYNLQGFPLLLWLLLRTKSSTLLPTPPSKLSKTTRLSMAHRRISSAEKGKGLDLSTQQPLRAARVKVPLPDNSELLRKHSLTLIGRVTNKTTQKVWSLIPFFTEHWKTEFKPVGSDLGNGMFQFQFELEADLLSVLEQRPYHYARWLIILQRWEPTVSPSFPSLIPFWIKVQGLPVHLWTEPTIKCIGSDIGIYEKAEIRALTARMRVHVNGLLPLITKSVVEYPNGDEVPVTLVYERLDKHCTKCLRLDHELKECLVARAEARALREAQEGSREPTIQKADRDSESIRGYSAAPAQGRQTQRFQEQNDPATFKFSAPYQSNDREKKSDFEPRRQQQNRAYKAQSHSWQERGQQRRTHQTRDRSQMVEARSSRSRRDYTNQNILPAPPSRSFYREVQKHGPDHRETGSSVSRNNQTNDARGNPHYLEQEGMRQDPLRDNSRDVEGVAVQKDRYIELLERESSSKRTEHEVGRGQLEDAVLQVVRASLNMATEKSPHANNTFPERVPATQRLGISPQHNAVNTGNGTEISPSSSQIRIPATQRLGSNEQAKGNSSGKHLDVPAPSPQERLSASKRLGGHVSPNSQARVPATLRLGPEPVPSSTFTQQEQTVVKRKPGRPPGRTKVPSSPSLRREASAKIRKVKTPRTTKCRRKLSVEESRLGVTKNKDKARGLPALPESSGANTHSSDNVPLSNMIPKSNRRKTGFRVPSGPVP